MDDQWIVGRSALSFENFLASPRVERMGGEAIDGFRGKRHQFAAPQSCGESAQILRGGGITPGLHENVATKKPEQVLRLRVAFKRRLLHRQQVARALDLGGDAALFLGGQVRIFTRENFAGVRDELTHQLRAGVRNLLGRESLRGWLLFGAAHD